MTRPPIDILSGLTEPFAPMGVYQVALDGSGTHGRHLAISYAGAIATQSQWNAFSETWDFLLRKHGLDYLKMAEAMTFYGEFLPKGEEWGTERTAARDALLLEFATAARPYDFRCTGVSASAAVFADLEKAADKKMRLFQDAVIALTKNLSLEHDVALICDIELDVEHNYRSWLERLKRTQHAQVSRIIGVCCMDDKKIKALQLADMIAFLLREEQERILKGNTSVPQNPLYAFLIDGSDVTIDVSPPGDKHWP